MNGRQFAVYLLASRRHGTLYCGMTSNLAQRIWQHREHVARGFTDDHDVTKLVWFETHDSAEAAIVREKQIKKWNRAWKVQLIERENPDWRDLYPEIAGG
ncbi:MAG TPA: GIY-YIG nuclease family protein [Devosiaceae bacterium]